MAAGPDAGGDTDAGWASFLDALESELHGIERAKGNAQLPRFVPPVGLGDLPGPLADRARSVLADIESAVSVVSAELARVAAQLEERNRLDVRGPAAASRIDTTL